MSWGKRCATIVGSAALGMSVLAVPAAAAERSSTAQWPICDYTPGPRSANGSPIDDRWNVDDALRDLFIAPAADEVVDGDVHYRDYTGPDPAWPYESRGRLYFADTAIGVHEVHGTIGATYRAAGGHTGLDVPITDECNTGDQDGDGEPDGKYTHFGPAPDDAEQSIYWRADTGEAFLITDEGPGPGLDGIHDHWEAAGWEDSTYGWPVSDMKPTEGNYGRYQDFHGDDGGGASIYWSPDTGTWGVKGAIRYRWLDLGAETSYLGYPTSDEYDTPDGKRSDFEGGCITWDSSTEEVVDSPDCTFG
jgi:hypothetical protein